MSVKAVRRCHFKEYTVSGNMALANETTTSMQKKVERDQHSMESTKLVTSDLTQNTQV